MRKYNINASIIQAIENLYNKVKSYILFNGNTGDCFRTTVGFDQDAYSLKFSLKIMSDALGYYKGSVSIGGWIFISSCFADDVVVNHDDN